MDGCNTMDDAGERGTGMDDTEEEGCRTISRD